MTSVRNPAARFSAAPGRRARVLVSAACFLVIWRTTWPPVRAHGAPPEPPTQSRAHAELAGLVGPNAKIIATRHFVVAYDTTVDTVHRLTDRLEATYRSIEKFCMFNGIGFDPPREPLEVLLFDTPEGFHRYAAALGLQARGLSGFYYAGTNRSAFFNILHHPNLDEFRRRIERLEAQVAGWRGRKLSEAERTERRAAAKQLHFYRNRRDRFVERLNRTVVQHEVAHHLLFDAGVHVKGTRTPDWLVEGLACLFEPPPSGKGAGIGVINQMRLADFREACGEQLGPDNKRPRKMKPADLQRAFETGRFVPLRRFIALDQLSDDPDDPNLGYYYAQAWGLTFYLQRTHREELARYIAALAGRRAGQQITSEDEIAQFEAVFGPADGQFERRWAAFIFNLRFVPEFPDG